MINCEELKKILKSNKIKNITGVPDSNLKELLVSLNKDKYFNNITAVNEGAAISIASGRYLSSGEISLVYLQNSGLGNAINPLTSLSNKEVYNTPLVLFIGWRGSRKDEIQHKKMGKITKEILNLLEIKTEIIEKRNDLKKLDKLIKLSKKKKKIVAALFHNSSFEKSNHNKTSVEKKINQLSREIVVKKIYEKQKQKSYIISSTGYISRQLYKEASENPKKNIKILYSIGSMGHTTSLSLGIYSATKSKVIVIDGDGSALMHLGSLSTTAYNSGKNYKYILINNGIHESVGGQSTNSFKLNFKKISEGLGFLNYIQLKKFIDLDRKINSFLVSSGPSFLEVMIKSKSNNELPRIKNLDLIKKRLISAKFT
ncbi:phosphonopyruvate decarboxylase [Candidatus Pelagibacter sp.]|uniref:phosphonopyruvate decarboxylase n=1 Tax=Candidatus Pelagibacter sp. TaxID=2024849 RepID=UPI003F84E3C0